MYCMVEGRRQKEGEGGGRGLRERERGEKEEGGRGVEDRYSHP